MKNFISVVFLFLIILVWSQSLPQLATDGQAVIGLPKIVYLGEGAATYTNDLGWNFIVKRENPNDFVWVPGPTYTADAAERVWRSQGTGGAPPFAYHEDTVFGEVTAGCLIRYVAIDDDVDDRRNSFFVNGTLIHTMVEGMVTEGEFIIPFNGLLLYDAKDSIGMYLDVCSIVVDHTPTPTPFEASTPTVTPSKISTMAPTQTPPANPLATPTPDPDQILTPTVTLNRTQTPIAPPVITPDSTIPVIPASPEPVVSQTPNPTPLPPRDKACLRINFEVGGDEARNGRFQVIEVSGRVLYTWDAQDGWEDSGWVHDIEITYRSVYVQVFYWANSSDPPITMHIVNPAPGTEYGWVSEGICHALEVTWP